LRDRWLSRLESALCRLAVVVDPRLSETALQVHLVAVAAGDILGEQDPAHDIRGVSMRS